MSQAAPACGSPEPLVDRRARRPKTLVDSGANYLYCYVALLSLGGVVLTVKNVVKSFGGLIAVNDCSFTIPAGSVTGLIGPNGAGKSTLFNIIAGFIKPDGGEILIEGQNVTGMSPHRLFHRGIVRTFQIPHEFDRMTVLENLMIVPPYQIGELVIASLFAWGRVKRQERILRKKAEEVLDFVSLSRLKYELAGNLSGGQKKLLELARTMMTNPRIVLLDEPGAGVNRTLLQKIGADIKRLNDELGYTFCIIEHDMDLVTRLCNPVVVMAQGSVLAEGTMEELRRDERVREAYLGGRV